MTEDTKGSKTPMTWGKSGPNIACHMGTCGGQGFELMGDLMYHVQEIHGGGYYKRPEPSGYYVRNPGEKDRKPERHNG